MKNKILFFALFIGAVSVFSGCASVMGPITDAVTQVGKPRCGGIVPCTTTKHPQERPGELDVVVDKPGNKTTGGLYNRWKNDKNIPTCVMGKCAGSVQDIKIMKPEQIVPNP